MEEAETPPYWQPTAPMTRRNSRRRPILHSSLVIIIVPSLSLLFIVFILLPSIPRIIPQPNSPFKLNSKAVSVKKSWDTLNIVLVVFAILCGVFARLNDDVPTQEERSNGGASEETRRSKSERRSAGSTPQWGGYEEQRIFNSPPSASVTGVSRLRRTVSEMPPSQWTAGNDRLRFYDDFDINTSYQIHPNQALHHYHHHYPSSYPELNQIEPETNRIEPSVTFTEPEIVPEDDGGSVKEISVETFVRQERADLPPPTLSPPRVSSSHAPPTPPPTPPPPPPLPPRPARTFQSIPSKTRVPQAPPPHPPPPPPRPPPSPAAWGEKKRRSSRKKMNATKEIATAIASLYNTHRKRKRKQKSSKQNSNYEEEDPSSLVAETQPPPTPPPPPPPPPSASVFHSLFRKGGNKTKIKSKKVHSLTSSIPEPPPPPPPRPVNSSRKPPLPSRSIPILFEREEGFPKSGSQSPATPIPPPPPPPTRLRRHDPMHKKGTREPEVDGSRSRESSSMATACPSPDVNAKADTFIARLHDGWRLEKLNSWREKRTVTDAVVAGGPQYEGLSN